jgi:hypothetical protein
MENKKKLIVAFTALGVGVVTYYIARFISKKYYYIGEPSNGKQKNFVNADGVESVYSASIYDPNHVNPDGSVGATWIAYNDLSTIGYWKEGFVQEGTPMYP